MVPFTNDHGVRDYRAHPATDPAPWAALAIGIVAMLLGAVVLGLVARGVTIF